MRAGIFVALWVPRETQCIVCPRHVCIVYTVYNLVATLVLTGMCARSHPVLSQPPMPQGAFGVVHRVLVTPVSGPAFEAARKRMPVGSPATRSVFEAEVHALKESLGCANIVQMLDARTTDEYHEVLLELLKGGTLTSELVSPAVGHGSWQAPLALVPAAW